MSYFRKLGCCNRSNQFSTPVIYTLYYIWRVMRLPSTICSLIYLTEKTLALKKYKPSTMRLQGCEYGCTFISKANLKFFQQSLHCPELLVRMQIPRVLCLRHGVVFPLYIIFKCTLAIWLRLLTVEISNEPYTNEVVRLSPRKLETAWPFLERIVTKASLM